MGQVITSILATLSIVTGGVFGVNIYSNTDSSKASESFSTTVEVETIVLEAGGSAGMQP